MTRAEITCATGMLILGLALLTGAPALAGDVSVRLDSGAGFSVKNSAGTVERLRVDEATGNVSRNGALFVHTTGTTNTFVGINAGNVSTSGVGRNSAFGASALQGNTSGRYNSAFGATALQANTEGYANSAFGDSALRSNTTGSRNSAIGWYALRYNTTGYRNSAFGMNALRANTTGVRSSAVGYDALRSNTTGIDNSAVGYKALLTNTTGGGNSAFGSTALAVNTTGASNSAFGNNALQLNSTGGGNTAVGVGALGHNTTAWRNSAVGSNALVFNTTGERNSAVGSDALLSNTTGSRNSAFGSYALDFNTTGYRNSAFGDGALGDNTTGAYNAAVGYATLENNTTGNRNIAIGWRAGRSVTTGSDNIYLRNNGAVAESNTIRIGTPGFGTPGTHTATFIAGIRDVTTTNANAIPVLIDSAGQLGTVSSSRSVKKEIRDMGDATARLLDLRPVMFRYKQEQTLPNGGEVPPEYGLIAEEVAEVFPDLVVYDEEGQPFTVKYHEMAPMLLNEMQKQQHTIESQRQAYEKEISALTTRLAQLEARSAIAPPDEAQR